MLLLLETGREDDKDMTAPSCTRHVLMYYAKFEMLN